VAALGRCGVRPADLADMPWDELAVVLDDVRLTEGERR